MVSRILLAGAVLLSTSASFAQMGQQRPEDLGGMSTPSSSSSSGIGTGSVGPSPLPIPQTQGPTIISAPQQPGLQGQQLQQLQQLQRQQAQQLPKPAADQVIERNEFQDFINVSTGKKLPIFGFNLFEAPSTFAPVENIPVTPDYTVGPGDELLVRAWGQIDVDYRAVIDRNGMINIPRVGSIPVSGVRYQDLTNHVRTAIARNFRNFELLVTMGQLRSVQIFVVGHARRPGAYTVSSLSTLVNAVFSAGGPAPHGSMRAIQLKRGNTIVSEIDLYDLLLSGDKSKDVPLLPGDVIYFPAAGSFAAVAGSVNNAAIFELKGQTNIGRLLELAGGLTSTAQSQRATLERIDDRKTRSVDQLALDYDGLKRPVHDGDLLSILAISPRFENAVTLRGNVATPLRFPHKSGMRIRDLIPEKEALITPEYYRRQNLSARGDALRAAAH
jgi:polysaccharide export outer membrane protein